MRPSLEDFQPIALRLRLAFLGLYIVNALCRKMQSAFILSTQRAANSIFKRHPRPEAKRFKVLMEGFALPFSSLLISAWAIPVRAANSFCVMPWRSRASIMARIIANSGSKASYSAFSSGSFSCSWRNSLNSLTLIPSFPDNLCGTFWRVLFRPWASSVISL